MEALFKVYISEEFVFGYNFVKNVKVKREFINSIDALEKFTAYRTTNTIIAQEISEAASAECMSATHNDSRNTVADVVFESTEVAEIKVTVSIVRLKLARFFFVNSLRNQLFLGVFSTLSTTRLLLNNRARSAAAFAHYFLLCLNLNN